MTDLKELYFSLKKLSNSNLKDNIVTEGIIELTKESLSSLSQYSKVRLNSSIPNKEYFVFEREGKYSRPVNNNLFLDKIPGEFFDHYLSFAWNKISPDQLNKVLYTIAMAYCAAIDVIGAFDKKNAICFLRNLYW